MNTTLNEGEFMVCALYPYQAQDMKQLSLKPHERIKVIQMHKSGWWIGENAAGEVALFPANYVRRENGPNSTDNVGPVKFNKPKAFKPELANKEADLRKSKTQSIMDSLGLDADVFGDLDKIDDLDDLLSDSDDESDLESGTDVKTSITTTSIDSEQLDELKRMVSILQKEKEEALKEKERVLQQLDQEKKRSVSDRPSSPQVQSASSLSSKSDDKLQTENEKLKQKLQLLTEKYNKDMKAAVEKIKKHKSSSSSSGGIGGTALTSQLIPIQNTLKRLKVEQQSLKQDAKTKIADIRADLTKLSKSGLGQMSEAIAEVTKKYQKELQERKKLFNELQELRGNIRVYVRVRPILDSDETVGNCIETTADEVRVLDINKKLSKFEFDRIFGPGSTQMEIFDDVRPLATSILDGYNVCIFAYGQTGSGKTHTMEGTPSDRGVNYRTLSELFNIVGDRRGDYTYQISVAVMEIYNETLVDLLSKDKQKLDIKMSNAVTVPGLTTVPVDSTQQVIDVLSSGYKNRAVGANNINAHSSRSHCIVSVYVEGVNTITQSKFKGKLHLIDLAGSERLKRTDTKGERLKETLAINKSLSSLGDVISALAAKKPHVPYRNSKLTSLLQDSLGGNSKALMFVNVSPTLESSPETICSLGFAQRVHRVELGKAEKNIV